MLRLNKTNLTFRLKDFAPENSSYNPDNYYGNLITKDNRKNTVFQC